MRAVIQRVKSASVHVDGKLISEISGGILTLIGFLKDDSEVALKLMVRKICEMRIFQDENKDVMSRSLLDLRGQHLLVSQFTLVADLTGGRRPSFSCAAPPEHAEVLYKRAIEFSQELGVVTFGGIFRTDMKISLINDGPVTFVIDG